MRRRHRGAERQEGRFAEAWYAPAKVQAGGMLEVDGVANDRS